MSAVRLRGQSPPGVLVFAIPIRSTPGTTCWKTPLSPAAMPAALDDALDAHLEAGHRQLVVLVGASLVERELGVERAARLGRLCRSRRLPSGELRVAALRNWLLKLLDLVGTSPGLLQRPTALRSIEADLMRHIAAAAQFPPDETGRGRRPGFERGGHARALANALDFVHGEDTIDLTIPVLCKALGVGQRTLEYAFRETFGLSPSGFLRLRHLHAARSRLLAADRSQMAVVDIAYQEGFYHLGRFAALYRRTFGELPSQTLKRACPPRLRELMAAPPLRVAERLPKPLA